MEWWLATLVFALTFTENAMSAIYTMKVIERRPLAAALIGSKIDLMGCLSVMAYTSQWEYIIPLYIGSFAGTYSSTYINRWYKRRERLKNLKKARMIKALKKDRPL